MNTMNAQNPSGPSLRNPLAETLKAGRLGLAMIVKQVHSVDIAVAARSCGFDAINRKNGDTMVALEEKFSCNTKP